MKHLCLYLLAIVGLSACAPSVRLSLKDGLRAGQRLVYKTTRTTETTAEEKGGESQTSTSVDRMWIDYEIRQVRPDGSFDAVSRILRMQREEEKNGETDVYDSDLPYDSADARARIMGAMIRHPFEMSVSPDGSITRFSGMETVWARISEEMKDKKGFEQIMAGIKRQFTDEAMKEQSSDFWSILPSKSVRKGKSWKKTQRLSAFGLQRSTTFTAADFNDGAALIHAVSEAYSDPKNPAVMDMGPIKIKFDLRGAGTGSYTVDRPVALLRSSEQTMEMSGTVEVKVTFLASQKVPMTVKVKVLTERVE